jgi:hypothetical protein
VKKILKIFSIALLALCILISPANLLAVTARFAVKNQNSALSLGEIANSSNAYEMIEDAYPYKVFEDRVLAVTEFGISSEDGIGLQACEGRRENFLYYNVSIGTFKVAKVRFAGSEWDIIICNNTANLNSYGKPTVPYKKMLVPLGDAEIVNIYTHEKLIKEIPETEVLPGLMPLPFEFNNHDWADPYSYLEENFYADPLIYLANQTFPSEPVQHEIVSLKGNRFLALTIFPFKFDPKNSTIKVFDISVSVELTKPASTISQLQSPSTSSENSGYVIIAPPEFSGAVESFSAWKMQLGFSVQIMRLDQIYDEFSGRDNAEKVRNFIIESYSENRTEYYLLVGDCDVCPVREVWDPANVGMSCDNGTEPSDLYYECLDGNWDANGNSIFGEQDDDVDLYPEVKVGRIPVSTAEDVERVLAMIRKIEENPEPGEWIKNFLLIAPSAFTPGDSSASLEEEVYQKYLAGSFFNSIRLYDVDGSLNPTAVLSAMNQGVGLVDFFDHGAYDQWVGALQTSDVLSLNNGNKTFLAFAMACETAAFDYQEYTTIAEAFFHSQNGGAVAYIGATRIAFAGYDCFDGLHHRFWNYFLKDAIEHSEANAKEALQEALVEMVSTYSVGGSSLETIYQAIYFGDPALNLHWKHKVTTAVTSNLEIDSNGVINGTCSMLYGDTPITGEYRVAISDPTGTIIAEKTGNLGSQGNYTVNFTTTNIPGNYTIKTSLVNPFNYTHISTFTVGTLNVTVKLDSNPVYGVPINVSGQVLHNGNPVAGEANVSIINKGTIVNSEIVLINSSGQYQTEINLTTFGLQSLHVWVSNDTRHGGTFATFKVKRADILIIADDCGAIASIYPGGWYDYNKGSSTSYYSFHHALIGEYNVSVYRLIFDPVPSLSFLQQYSAVIVTCGDHYGSCLTSVYRDLTQVLKQYHNTGGDLMFEGGDIAYSLAAGGYTQFMQSVLHVNFTNDITWESLALNNGPHPITQGLPLQMSLAGGLGSPSADLVLPTNGSEMVSSYIGYSGSSITAFSGGSGLGSVVYFSFSIDGISDEAQRNLMIRNSAVYLLYPTLQVELSDYALLVNTSESIQIHVTDSDTSQPIKNATVTFDGCGVSFQNKTDSNGECSMFIRPTSAGIINITTEKTEYPNFTTQIIVYSMPKLAAQITPDTLRKKTQIVNVKVTDFYEHTDVDLVTVTLSGCGVSVTDSTNLTGIVEFTITPTSYGRIQLNASKYGYDTYTDLVDVCINAVIIDSFGTDYPFYSRWDDLNNMWQQYGTIPLHVDYESLNKYEITYQDLVQSEADVLIISCAASINRVYTDNEISAIRRYTFEGHGLIATAGTFYMETNNNKLAPIFGMRDDICYSATYMANSSLNILDTEHPLFNNIPASYTVATGATACPPDLSWDQDDLSGGTYVAMSPAYESTIIVHNGAVFVSHWVEYMSNNYDFQLMYNALVWSKFEAPEHDLEVTLDAPSFSEPEQPCNITTRIYNVGRGNETDVFLTLSVNNTIINSTIIMELPAWSSHEISYLWTPTLEGTYNITARITPVLGEENILNNEATTFIDVKYPLINPIEGQWAYYDITYFDENGEILELGKIKVTYVRYVAPYLIYVSVEAVAPYMKDSAQTLIVPGWMVVNTFSRTIMEGAGVGTSFPYWIETDITLGSEVRIGSNTAIVVGDQIIRINGRPIDCWILIWEGQSQENATCTLWFDKASGLWISEENQIQFHLLLEIEPTVTITSFYLLDETNIPIGYEHELEVALESPASISLDETALINVTIYNFGRVEEIDVRYEILINGSIVCSGIIPKLNNGSSSTLSYLWTPNKKGMYNVTAYVHPVPGENIIINNVESKKAEVTCDSTPPTISIISPADNILINSTFTEIVWLGNDDDSGIDCYFIYLNGELVGNSNASTTSWWLSNLPQGSNNITIVAYDKAGNHASDQITVTVDLSQPTVEIMAPENESYLKETALIIVSGCDTHFDNMTLWLNETSVATFTDDGASVYTWNTSLIKDGTYTIKLVAYDKAGNKAEVSILVIVDNTSPQVVWVSPSTGSYVSGMAKLMFDYQEPNVCEALLQIDGGALANVTDLTSYLWNTTAMSDGEHILILMVLDKAGNINNTLATIINIDNTSPVAEITEPDDAQFIHRLSTVSFMYYDENLENVTLKIDSEVHDVTNTTKFMLDTTELSDGNYTIVLTVVDKAKNIIEQMVTITVDNTNPEVDITYYELNGTKLTGIVIIEFNASDKNLGNVLLYIDAAAFDVTGLHSYEWNTTEVGDGAHIIRLVAYDKAGNMGETSPLTVETTNIQQGNEENYLAGRDFGLIVGAALGLTFGLIIGFAVMLAARKKRKLSES